MFGDSFGTTQSGGFVVYVNGALVPLGEDGLWKWGVSSVQCSSAIQYGTVFVNHANARLSQSM